MRDRQRETSDVGRRTTVMGDTTYDMHVMTITDEAGMQTARCRENKVGALGTWRYEDNRRDML
jgi:hypothetical protein